MAADAARPPTPAPFAFAGTIAATRLSWAYRSGLLIVAVAMLLLPLVYLGVIALAATGVWWHVTRNAWLIGGGASALQWRLLAYVGPALAGVVVTWTSPRRAQTERRRDELTPLAIDSMARLQQVLTSAACPALLDVEGATLADACHLHETGDDALLAMIAVETLYTRLLLEVSWLAQRGEAVEATRTVSM
jgi:hypothetical protein